MAKRKKGPAGSVELNETELDQVQGGLLPTIQQACDGSVMPTDQHSIKDGTSNTMMLGEKHTRSGP